MKSLQPAAQLLIRTTELFISRLRRREIRLHAFLFNLRCRHCLLQPLHHIHDLLHGQVSTLSSRRTLPGGSHFQRFLETHLTVTTVLTNFSGEPNEIENKQ